MPCTIAASLQKTFFESASASQRAHEARATTVFLFSLHLITLTRKNKKNSLIHICDKTLLSKRSLIEVILVVLRGCALLCPRPWQSHRDFPAKVAPYWSTGV